MGGGIGRGSSRRLGKGWAGVLGVGGGGKASEAVRCFKACFVRRITPGSLE